MSREDPMAAIRFALSLGAGGDFTACFDFLESWADRDWSDIGQAYPEFLQQSGTHGAEAAK